MQRDASADAPPNATLLAHLEAGGIVLTSTRRQARMLRLLHDQAQLAAGRQCWPTAQVMPLASWLAQRWDEAAAADPSLPQRLGDAQALWPWRRAAGDILDPTLVPGPDLAAAARRAWLSLYRHGGTLASLDTQALTRDQRQFREWAASVERSLRAAGWLDPGLLETAVAQQAPRLAPGPPLLLAGFADPAPATRALVQALASRGFKVGFAAVSGPVAVAQAAPAPDPQGEVEVMLSWARERLELDPGARLALIVPDLQSRRAMIERALEATLQPTIELPGTLEHDRLFDLAGGWPLSSLEVAQVAIDALACAAPTVQLDCLSRLLRSRYVLPDAAASARTALDLGLREAGVASWQLDSLQRRAGRAGLVSLQAALLAGGRGCLPGPPPRPLDAWARCFGETLAAWGWPGAGLQSDEYQAAQAVQERLRDLASLASAAPALSFDDALAEFRRLLAAPFQAERGPPRIWLFDTLEPPGLGFDGLWVAGMTAANWPPPSSPDPFLPLGLQRTLGMPRVTAEDSLQRAQATLDAWLGTAGNVVFSWPLRQDDAEVEPSRLLPPQLPACLPLRRPRTRAQAMFDARRLETLDPDPAPALGGSARGGARILELQAKCPFRAFAELRLGARPVPEPAPGVDRRRRGLVLHRALELVWRSLGSRAALEALSPDTTDRLVDESLDKALHEELPAELGERSAALEREWQRAAILRQLQLDLARADFEIAGLETEINATLEGLAIRLRADRIDRIDAGLIILDYKTGQATPSQWRSARPEAPQLPLYAVLQDAEVAGIAFARVGAYDARLAGVGASGELLRGMVAAERFKLTEDDQAGHSWAELRERWSGWLSALARAHRDGIATVDPKRPQTCGHCHLGSLCRVAPGDEDEATEEGHD